MFKYVFMEINVILYILILIRMKMMYLFILYEVFFILVEWIEFIMVMIIFKV